MCPPAFTGVLTAASADAALGAAGTRPAAGVVPGAQSAGGSASPPSARQGGGAWAAL